MSEKKGIAGELERGFAGQPWHGPSVTSVLQGVTAAEAAARPLPAAHSIWEIVLHMTGWTREVARRLHGGEPAMPAGGDWPAPPAAGDPALPALDIAWERAVAALHEAHREVIAALAAFPEERLREHVGLGWHDLPLGTGVPYRVMLHGLAQHHAYHAGQIAVLRKGTRS